MIEPTFMTLLGYFAGACGIAIFMLLSLTGWFEREAEKLGLTKGDTDD